MKKIFVLAVVIVLVGVLCAFLFNRKEAEPETHPDEKPWTVGDISETSEESTAPIVFDDAVMCFSNFINTELREKYNFIAETTVYKTDELSSSILGLYVYDIDSDEADELSVIYTNNTALCIDVYEFSDGETKLAATADLTLDPMDQKLFTTDIVNDHNIAARLSIFPNGKERSFCLTCELAEDDIGYNAYTVVFDYADGEITLRNSFRLRNQGNKLTLVSTSNATPLYSATGTSVETSTGTEDVTDVTEAVTELDVTVESDFDSLPDAFNDAFKDIGLKAPDVAVNGAALSKYKVTPVENEQKIFDFAGGNGEVMFSENGFLHSFILD